MKKEDLKTGMVLEFKDGNRGFIIENEIFLIDLNHRFAGSLAINPDLTDDFILRGHHGTSEIIRIYTPITRPNTNIGINFNRYVFNNKFLFLIWERPKEIEKMTLAEVCKELGRDIMIIKE